MPNPFISKREIMNRNQNSLPSPPKSWLQSLLLLKVAIAIALLITGLSLSSCTRQNLVLVGTPLEWKDAAKIVPQDVIATVIQQTTSLSPAQQQAVPIQVAHLHGKETVVFLNFSQVPELCGELGCLVIAHFANRPQSPVWSTYVSPNLPKAVPLLAQFDRQSIPSLVVNQLEEAQIRQMLYTWHDSGYQLEKSLINK
jgi:hypothetical protein